MNAEQLTTEQINEQLTADGWSIDVKTIDAGGYFGDSRFEITISHNGPSFMVPYSQGTAHRVWASGNRFNARTTKTGVWARFTDHMKKGEPIPQAMYARTLAKPVDCADPEHQQRVIDDFANLTDPKTPILADVIYSVMSDIDCVRHGQDFADFCGDMGYNTDSVKARKMFDACRDEAAGMVRLGADFDQLTELFQGY